MEQIKYLSDGGKEAGEEERINTSEDDIDVAPWNKARASMRRITSYSEIQIIQSDVEDDDRVAVALQSSAINNIEEDGDEGEEEELSDSDETLFYDADSHHCSDRESYLEWESLKSINVKGDDLCPIFVQLWRGKGKTPKYATYFAVVGADDRVVFREWRHFQKQFSSEDRLDMVFVPSRASKWEKKRRIIGNMMARDRLDGGSSGVQECMAGDETDCDRKFLRRSIDSFVHSSEREKSLAWDCVARARSERHWVEESVAISSNHVSFFEPGCRYPLYRIDVESIISVSALDGERQKPKLNGYHFMVIEVLGHSTYLMVSDKGTRSKIINVIIELARSSSTSSKDDWHLSLDDPAKQFLHKSTSWDCKQRRILNCQDLVFHSPTHLDRANHPCDYISNVLLMALDLNDMACDGVASFLHKVSQLKAISTRQLTEDEKLAFFLNLYHVMILHAYYVLGPPPTSNVLRWANYFNTVSYQCCDDIFSIAELEHCIIRTNPPSHFTTKFAIPKSSYTFALQRSDFRINFALNCGSLSNPESVLVYNPNDLDHQLDSATRLYIQQSASFTCTERKCIATLPRICSWFSSDFGDSLIATLGPYFTEKQQSMVDKYSLGGMKLKYQPYNFNCRPSPLILFQPR